MRRITPVAFCVLLVTVGVADAQVTRVPRQPGARARQAHVPRLHINLDAGLTAPGPDLEQHAHPKKNAEDAPLDITLTMPAAPYFDLGGWYELNRRYGVGVSFAGLSRTSDGSLVGTIGQPFFFNQQRPISGTFGDIASRELAVHIDVVAKIPLKSSLLMTVFAGPSLISVRQALVNDVTVQESYPYDTATFDGVGTEVAKKSGLGYNAGADISAKLTPSVSVGGMVRFVGGSVHLPSTVGDPVAYKPNSVRVSGGIRLLF